MNFVSKLLSFHHPTQKLQTAISNCTTHRHEHVTNLLGIETHNGKQIA